MDRAELAGALIDACPDGLLLVDRDGVIQLVNPVAAEMFGRTEDDLVGSPIEDLVPPEFRPTHPQRRAAYTAAPTSRPMGTGLELFAQHSSGEMFPVEISLSPCVIDDVLFTIATIRDVSDRQESASQMAMLQDRERIAGPARHGDPAALRRRDEPPGGAVHREPQLVADRIGSTIIELDDPSAKPSSPSSDSASTTNDGRCRHRSPNSSTNASHLGFERHSVLPATSTNSRSSSPTSSSRRSPRGCRTSFATRTPRPPKSASSAPPAPSVLRISDNGVGLPNEPKRSGGLSNMMWRAAELGGTCTVATNDPTGTQLLWNVPI